MPESVFFLLPLLRSDTDDDSLRPNPCCCTLTDCTVCLRNVLNDSAVLTLFIPILPFNPGKPDEAGFLVEFFSFKSDPVDPLSEFQGFSWISYFPKTSSDLFSGGMKKIFSGLS